MTNLTALLFMASLWTALRWWQTRQPADLWWTAFLWGLGLYAKLLFAWAIGAMSATMLVVFSLQRRSDPQVGHPPFRPLQLTLRVVLIALGCFLVPLLPLIVFNLQTGGTLISIFSNLGQSYYGVNNRAYLPNLLTRIGQLITLWRGDHLWYLGEVYANRWAPWLTLASAGSAAVLWAWPRRSAAGRGTTLLPFILVALVVAQSAFTVSDLFITHYALIVPLVPLGIGLTAGELWESGLRHRVAAFALPLGVGLTAGKLGKWLAAPMRWPAPQAAAPTPQMTALSRRALLVRSTCGLLLAAALLLWAITDLTNTLRYHRILAVSGGYASHSDAIYHLAAYLQERKPAAPLALDWGIDAPVRFLTAGRVNPVEVFGYGRLDGPDADFAGRVAPFLDNPHNLYVAHIGEFSVFRGRVEALEGLAASRGQRLVEAARFGERSGRPLFVVYRTVK